jgi:hypothetical protein
MASQHHIENQVLIDEVYNIGQMIMKGQLAQPGQPGSLPGIAENKPETTMGGIQGGPQSLNLPLAGNAQG